MTGSGTDSTKPWVAGGPVVILVEPQLGQNVGSAARAMGNFGLARLRLVNPREGWPNENARIFSAGADRILEGVEVFPDLRAALADMKFAFAATARERGMAKPVMGADAAAVETHRHMAGGEDVALVFGRERTGLYTEEVSLCDAILTLPVNPAFASLNLATCVAVAGYEWCKLGADGALPFAPSGKSPLADKQDLFAFFDHLEGALEGSGFFRSSEKQPSTTRNIRNIFHRLGLTRQDLATLHGVVTALEEGQQGREARKQVNSAAAEIRQQMKAALRTNAAASKPRGQGPREG